MPKRYACIHGHFYQPPRENPWLEAVEMQESAWPDHDWNERITRECYAANAKARLLDGEGWLARVVNNYARMSFNMGPTLLAWMQEKAPGAYRAVLEADKVSAERFGGHGSAMAQGYNHTILPLCNERDLRTQVLWGVVDFRHRFGRDPEGMWLPETAVNTPTLEMLAEHGVKFTVLAPRQAESIRPLGPDGRGEGAWTDVGDGVDPSRAYLCNLPSGRTITLFFYDGPVSQAVAFERLLDSGEAFAGRIMSIFDDAREHDELAHIATDGESYGHHHRHGEMALAAALERLEADHGVQITNYGEFLEMHPPTWEAQIRENTSWSCAHGIERWKSDCGCCGGRPGCHQRWRAPLRAALDWLRDAVAGPYERVGGEIFKDAWAARDAYVRVILDRSPENVEAFLAEQGREGVASDPAARVRALELLEMQRHAMLMYTSCGWFFDDIAGIETTQVIQYAARVVQIASSALGLDLEGEFLERLEQAPGSEHGRDNGRLVYEQAARPAMVDLPRVAAHHAINSIFDPREGDANVRVYAFDVEEHGMRRRSAGRARLLTGQGVFTSRITTQQRRFSYAVLDLGDHNITCAVREADGQDEQAPGDSAAALEGPFDRGDFAAVIRAMDQAFGPASYGIASLFRDEQHRIVRRILEPRLEQIDTAYRQIYEQHAPMARFFRSLSLPVPRRIQMVASAVISQGLIGALLRDPPDGVRIRELVEEAAADGVEIDAPTLNGGALEAAEKARELLRDNPRDAESMADFLALASILVEPPFSADPWPLQEAVIDHALPLRGEMSAAAEGGDEGAAAWLEALGKVLERLRMRPVD